ncbi:MAG: hypothetical protein Q9227_000104 [Pyrenula ochraceoflavens]
MAAFGTNDSPEIIDSHIHLYAASHLPTLSWAPSLPSTHVLNRQNSITQYRAAISSPSFHPPPSSLRGFIFLETDRLSHPTSTDPSTWTHPLAEISFLFRIATGQPLAPPPSFSSSTTTTTTPRSAEDEDEDEGFIPADAPLLLAIIPWAPLAAGPTALSHYISLARSPPHCPSEPLFRNYVKGFRYLLQDKPAGTLSSPAFVDSLRWMAREGYVFDLGVDARQGGVGQVREVCEVLDELARDSDGGGEWGLPKVVVNHLCKPNLRIPLERVRRDGEFLEWKECMERMARYEGVYMKLSGLFSEMEDGWLEEGKVINDVAGVVESVYPWVEVIFDAFGAQRVMFGSDWPVCNVGGGGAEVAWGNWRVVVEGLLEKRGMRKEEKRRIWAGTAREAYGID